MAKRHGAPWSRRDYDLVRNLVRAGTPGVKIAKALGRSLRSLYVVASREGIPLRRKAAKRSETSP